MLLLNDPTRGVDQRTRETLYQVFRDLARNEGMALVAPSTEIEELLRLRDRVLVFRETVPSSPHSRGDISHDQVIAAMLDTFNDCRDHFRRHVRAPLSGCDGVLLSGARQVRAGALVVLLAVTSCSSGLVFAGRVGPTVGFAAPLVVIESCDACYPGGRGGIDAPMSPSGRSWGWSMR